MDTLGSGASVCIDVEFESPLRTIKLIGLQPIKVTALLLCLVLNLALVMVTLQQIIESVHCSRVSPDRKL